MKRTYLIRLQANDPKPVIRVVAHSLDDARTLAFVMIPRGLQVDAVIEESEEPVVMTLTSAP